MNKSGKILLETVLSIVSCYSSIQALTQQYWTCWLLLAISAVVLGLSFFWLRKEINTERSVLFIVASVVMIISSVLQLRMISQDKKRSESWKSYTQSKYFYTGGRYIVEDVPTDGPSAMDVARQSLNADDFITAKEYAEKAKSYGVPEAYQMLTFINYYGLGVNPDYRIAFRLGLEQMKLAKVTNAEELYEAAISSGYSPTSTELADYERLLEDNRYLIEVEEEIACAAEVSRKKIKSVLNSHHKRLVELSESGSIEAVFMLYMECVEEKWSNPQRGEAISGKTREYAERLAAADFLPTDP